MTAPPRRYRLDGSVRRVDDGRVLIGGSPLKLLRLTATGAALIDRLAAGATITANSLVDRLLDGGVIHPDVEPDAGSGGVASDGAGAPFGPGDVTAVIPTLDTPVDVLVTRLLSGPDAVVRVIVVDDGSTRRVVATPAGPSPDQRVDVVRLDRNGGPATARTRGLERVTTPLVLFVDADVQLDDGPWLAPLLAHLADDRLALVAPRVTADMSDESRAAGPVARAIAAYERARSPLDLGGAPGPVRARTRVSYVPSAVWLARVDAVRAVGGFDAAMRTGEDVDLVWRLDEAGWRTRYEPAAVVHHSPRRSLAAFVRQRRGYGASAGPLARRHPGALAPVGVSAWSAGTWALAATGPAGVVAGVAVGAGSAVALARKLTVDHPVQEAMRLAGRGHLYAGRQLASAVARPWWPVALATSLVSRRARRAVAVAVLWPALSDWYGTRRAHGLDPFRYLALRLLDDGAYGAGVWQGAVRAGTVAPLVPDLTSWPRPSRYEQRQRPAAAR